VDAQGWRAPWRIVKDPANSGDDMMSFLRDVGTVRWQQLPDGRYLCIEKTAVLLNNVLHECPYDEGGNAGDRSPRPSPPPHRSAPTETDLPSP
jgi:hypothetical protein